MGVTSGYDFFGEHAVYVEGFAQDGYCSNTMRSLTDKEVIKHVGEVRNFRTWWEEILAKDCDAASVATADVFTPISRSEFLVSDTSDTAFGSPCSNADTDLQGTLD